VKDCQEDKTMSCIIIVVYMYEVNELSFGYCVPDSYLGALSTKGLKRVPAKHW